MASIHVRLEQSASSKTALRSASITIFDFDIDLGHETIRLINPGSDGSLMDEAENTTGRIIEFPAIALFKED